MSVHVYTHSSSSSYTPAPGHPETPERVRAVTAALRSSQLASRVAWHEAPAATDEQLLRAHPASHLERLAAIANRGGAVVQGDTLVSAKSLEAARHAAGGAIAVARHALRGEPAFAAMRPPGHHATATVAMGFCLFNNVVVAARAAQAEDGIARVLIVDWDVHHGNGTQELVESDERIRYVSLHQWPLYPGTGKADERGVGNVFNYPMPPGLPRADYIRALNEGVERATDGWVPDLILLSAGFDALAGDLLGGFTLEPEDYAAWVAAWRGIGAPIGSVLEGGYVPARIALAAVSHLEALAG